MLKHEKEFVSLVKTRILLTEHKTLPMVIQSNVSVSTMLNHQTDETVCERPPRVFVTSQRWVEGHGSNRTVMQTVNPAVAGGPKAVG